MTHIYHIVGDSLTSGVLESQVLVPLKKIGETAPGYHRGVLFLILPKQKKDKTHFLKRKKEIETMLPGAKLGFCTRVPISLPLYRFLWAYQIWRFLKKVKIQRDDRVVLHCRGTFTAAAASVVKKMDSRVRILVDLRGICSDEVKSMGLKGKYLAVHDTNMIRIAMKSADAVNTVSEAMAEMFIEKGNLPADRRRICISCCADTQRFYFDPELREKRRKELGLASSFVFCYCGDTNQWQRPDAVAEFFSAVQVAMPDARFLVVSKEPESLQRELDIRGVPAEKTVVVSAKHEEVCSYLLAADVGLLLREDRPTNQVAAPVKFAEYLRCGLPVILTPYIGDFGKLALSEDVGVTISFPVQEVEAVLAAKTLREKLGSEGDSYRRHVSDFAKERLSWDGQLPRLLNLYNEICEK